MARIKSSPVPVRIVEKEDTTVLIPLTQNLGIVEMTSLVTQLARILVTAHARIVLDLELVKTLSFAAVGFLAQMRELAERGHRELAVRNAPTRLRAELELYHLDTMVEAPVAAVCA